MAPRATPSYGDPMLPPTPSDQGNRPDATSVVGAFLHLCLDPFIGTAELVVVTTGASLAAGLAVTVVGAVVVAAGTLWALLQLGRLERARANALLGAGIPPLLPDRRPHRFGWFGRMCTSTQAWRAAAYAAVHPVVGTVLFSVVVSLWSAGVAGVLLPLYLRWLPGRTAHLGVADVHGAGGVALVVVGGLLLLILAPFATLAAGAVDRALARGLLSPSRTEALEAEVREETARRAAAMDAAEAERRRIERDLHDGAQQRLVSLGMTLGLAREKLDADPERARALMDEAHEEAKAAMTELRAIARGIHPAILDDRGLDAALSALAARSPVPVETRVDLPERLGPDVEGAAYYVVSEALTNVAKHAGATRATVDVLHLGPELLVRIADDGGGGAAVAADGGLAGLRSRLAALGGTLEVHSPPGGHTILTAHIPLPSRTGGVPGGDH